MVELTSKLQLKNYEKGEFSNFSKRTYVQTLNLIYEFPWNEQRDMASVELTGPSIIIERDDQSFLKIGHYYSGKFILYILNNNRIYKKILPKLNEFEYYLKLFFDNEFDKIIKDCVKKSFIYNPVDYFKTKSFRYSLNLKGIIRMLSPVIYTFVLITLFSTAFFTDFNWNRIFFLTLLWLILNAAGIYLLINHANFCRNLELVISKGQDEFRFGKKGHLKLYNKQNISTIKKYKHQGSRNLWNNAVIYEIQFMNGEIIKFPSLLLSDGSFLIKFGTSKTQEIHKFLAFFSEDDHNQSDKKGSDII